MPSEYYREVFGGEMSDVCEFASLEQANEILGLMMRHWNTIAATLYKGEVYVPLLPNSGRHAGGEGLECTLGLRHEVKGVVAVRCKIIVRQRLPLRIVSSR